MISSLYKLALAALLGLSLAACGGSGSPSPTPQASHEPPRSLHTGRVLLLGGNALFDREPATLRLVRHDYGTCADNLGVANGDSASFMSYDAVGALTKYPGTVVIVADAFELTYAERWRTLDNLTAATLNASVTGAKVQLVGVIGADEFNTQLRDIARAYGAELVLSIEVSCS